ncbi:MAG TPA: DUF47 family protein [Candidatus Bathyarchaeota archaeon]|nr:DUF47 family protein [Candidatus Bathyarchaeota archaeon]
MAEKYIDYFKRRETAGIIGKIREHAVTISDTIHELERALKSYDKGEMDECRTAIERVKTLENEADSIRRMIGVEIARSGINSRDAEAFLALSNRVDLVGDEAKNAALTLEIIVELGIDIGQMKDKLCKMTHTLSLEVEQLVKAVNCLFEDLDFCLQRIEEVGRLEHEIDIQYHEAKKMLDENIGIKGILLLNDILTEIESSSDLAEDASDLIDMLRIRFSLPGHVA